MGRVSVYHDFEPSTPGCPPGVWPLLGFNPWDRESHDSGLLCQTLHPGGVPRYSGAVCCCCGACSLKTDLRAALMDRGQSDEYLEQRAAERKAEKEAKREAKRAARKGPAKFLPAGARGDA